MNRKWIFKSPRNVQIWGQIWHPWFLKETRRQCLFQSLFLILPIRDHAEQQRSEDEAGHCAHVHVGAKLSCVTNPVLLGKNNETYWHLVHTVVTFCHHIKTYFLKNHHIQVKGMGLWIIVDRLCCKNHNKQQKENNKKMKKKKRKWRSRWCAGNHCRLNLF